MRVTSWISSLLLIASASLAWTACRPASSARPPNILVILTDDQGWGDISLHGNPDLRTPRLDALARSGARFDRFYVNPLCSPTRAAFLTGRDSLRGGVWGVTRGKETLRAEETTLAEILRTAGYRTAMAGKWHNGEHYPYSPEGQGFESFFGFRRGHWNNYFDTWFRDVTREGFTRLPIPVGHAEENPVSLPATQAWFEGGPAFEQRQGWANDWLTSWTSSEARLWWELDVAEAGAYDVSLEYLCPEDEAGARVRLSAAGSEATATVAGTAIRQVPSPDRVPRKEVYEMEWEQLPVGSLELPRGHVRLSLRAVENTRGRVMDLMAVRLERRTAR